MKDSTRPPESAAPGLDDLVLDRPGAPPAAPPAPGKRGGAPPPPSPPGRSGRRRRLPWPALLAVLAAAALLGALAWWRLWVPEAELEPASLNFGAVKRGGESPEHALMVASAGRAPLLVESVELDGEHAAEFRLVTDDCSGARLEAPAVCAVSVAFTPSELGPRRAELVVRGNTEAEPHRVPLLGTGTEAAAEVAPARLEFGDQRLDVPSAPRAVELRNSGTAPLAVTGVSVPGDAFVLASGDCRDAVLEPGEACTARVLFRPLREGSLRGTLRLEHDGAGGTSTVSLAGRGVAPRLELSPETVVFPPRRVGTAGEPRALGLTNTGTAPLAVGEVGLEIPPRPNPAPAPPFAVTADGCGGSTLTPGESCEITLVFRPAAAGAASGRLLIAHDAAGGPTTVTLSGTGTEPRAELSRGGLEFGEQAAGGAGEPRALELANRGTAPLAVGDVRVSGRSFEIARQSCRGATLAPGESCRVEVRFRPTGGGAARGELTFTHDAPGGASTAVLAGTGTVPRLELDRESVDFGAAAVGETTAARAIILANTGRAPLEVGEIRVEGGDFVLASAPCAGGSLGPGESCEARLAFRPRAGGEARGRLLVAHNAAGGGAAVSLTGRGTVPRLAVEPRSLDFGEQPLGQPPAGQLVVLASVGSAPLEVTAIRLGGRDAASFRITTAGCDPPRRLAPGESCRVVVAFDPAAPGSREAAVVIEHGAPDSPLRLPLRGIASPPPVSAPPS